MKATKHCNIHIINFSLMLALLLYGMLGCMEATASVPATQSKITKATPAFATVGNTVITWKEYRNAYTIEAKNKFYHGKPNDDEVAAFQREVGNKLVTDALLIQEAKRRNLKPDGKAVSQELQQYDLRFANDPKWPDARKRVLPIITKRLQNQNVSGQLVEIVRNSVPAPTEQQLRQYFDAHSKKFTSPAQPRVSLILIRVEPSATQEEWRQATEEAQGLVKRARAGEDFGSLAREYSGDETADAGGDMGFLHAGMLPGLPDEVVSKLQPGEISDPVKLLEGMAIFKLTGRIQPPPSTFESAQQRVSEMWLSEQRDNAWNSFIAGLRKKTPVHIDESHFLPLAVDGNPAQNSKGTLPTTKY